MSKNTISIKRPLPGPKSKAVIDQDEQFVSPSYTRDFPLCAEKGEGCWIIDSDGNRFLDFSSGIAVTATGHCHPKVVQAIKDQADQLLHLSGTNFYYPTQSSLAKKLAEIAPGDSDKKVFFCNSGAEAIEGAIKMAREHTRRQRIIGFFGAFHGRTYGAMSLTASKVTQQRWFGPLLQGFHHAPYCNPLRFRNDNIQECCDEALAFIEKVLFKRNCPPEEVAAIVLEVIQGEGGYIVPPDSFVHGIKRICDENGILLVVDEIQTGFGRTGKMFASEHFGIEPDIMTTAKGIASGLPLGAIIAKKEVMTWEYGAHASTFGGNPVACAASLATIELLEDGLVENAAKMGDYLKGKLNELKEKHKIIGDVRGMGLMLGAEVVKDKSSMEPSPELRNEIVEKMVHRGVILIGCGDNTLRFVPPLIVDREEIDLCIQVLDQLLGEY